MQPLSKAAFMLLNCRCSLHGGSTQCNISIFYPYRGMEDGDEQEESSDCERRVYILAQSEEADDCFNWIIYNFFKNCLEIGSR